MIQELLNRVGEDKFQNPSTTSLKFKEDLYKFFYKREFRDKTCVEFGTHKGQTTFILSHLFAEVITVNISEESLETAKLLNSDRPNIKYVAYDLYSNPPHDRITDDVVDVVFIDAGHERDHILNDVVRVMYMNIEKEVHLIFDDYGAWPAINEVVNGFVEKNKELEIIEYIGHPQGTVFGNGQYQTLKYGTEGVICKWVL